MQARLASQARAARQSRLTVATETPSSSAVSGMDSPAKYRLSIISACLGYGAEFGEGAVEGQDLPVGGGRGVERLVERHQGQPVAVLRRPAPAGGIHQDLAHGAGGDPLEVQFRLARWTASP